ncbi:hypothetical protein [Agromyces sp. CF514]|uniref:hypothetical protein n=1 Tax=Agromyces sp. CF514 TaxID=1881031 RepID=UPI000B8534F8|nr:hypothetical protein [Agromyces sp. CF514]
MRLSRDGLRPAAAAASTLGLLALGAALLTGCSAGAPAPAGPATSEPPAVSASPSDSVAEPATGTGTEAAAATCESVLSADANAQLAADGLDQVDVGQSTFYAIADDLIAAGGLACKWGRPSSDVAFTVVQLAGLDVPASEWPAALAEAGYTLTDDPVPGTYTGPADPGTGVPSVVVVGADRLTFVSVPLHAVDLAEAS